MKHKYRSAFMIFDPEGNPLPFLISAQRNQCHFNFDRWHPDLTWKQASRRGWKVRKICYFTV